MTNTVVFGAAGWLGSAILANLAGRHQVRAFDRGPEAWKSSAVSDSVRIIHGDIADYPSVENAISGMDAIVHAAVYAGSYDNSDEQPFRINLKGLWNVLEAARQHQIKRVVHIGSCQVVHPEGIFFDAEVRRPDGSLYAVTKRLQEEMCRQFHQAHGLSILVLRPCSIIDSRLGRGKNGKRLGPGSWNESWVCRHDLAEACRLGIEKPDLGLEILHTVGTTEAEAHCNVRRSRELLGLEYHGDLDQYR